jgi:hypothetical protein
MGMAPIIAQCGLVKAISSKPTLQQANPEIKLIESDCSFVRIQADPLPTVYEIRMPGEK